MENTSIAKVDRLRLGITGDGGRGRNRLEENPAGDVNKISTAGRKGLYAFATWLLLVIIVVSTGAAAEASGSKLTHDQAASKLRAAGISWSSTGDCSERDNQNCTSFERIRSKTIEGVIHFKRVSGCAINVTGGTEVGHSDVTYSHYKGYKVDISRSRCVTTYIVSRYQDIGRSKEGYRQFKRGDATYSLEPDHWDILYR
jgi:hypothetical protein